jgi:hypothetical protein
VTWYWSIGLLPGSAACQVAMSVLENMRADSGRTRATDCLPV